MANDLKKRVMTRVYIQFFKNTVIENGEYILLAFLFVSMLAFVSIMDVLHNMPKDNLSHTFGFLTAAVKNTEWFIKAVLAYVIIWSSVYVSKFAYKNIRKYGRFGLEKMRILA
jgi:hypothetical protein